MTTKGLEDKSLRAYYKWLKLNKWDTNYYHVANELPAYSKEMQRFAANLKHKGKKSGVADIIIFEQHNGYGALFIELKTPTGKASLEQLVFLSNANNNGYLGCVAYSFDEAMKITKWYMKDSTDPMPIKIVNRKVKGIEFKVLEVIK